MNKDNKKKKKKKKKEVTAHVVSLDTMYLWKLCQTMYM